MHTHPRGDSSEVDYGGGLHDRVGPVYECAAMRHARIDPTDKVATLDMDVDEAHEYIELYVANPIFRSATADELVIADNPFRRPVRPEDLTFVDYSQPVPRQNPYQLSALMAHRILLNIYESDVLLLPPAASVWPDFESFYSDRNRVLGEIIRPFLEKHVFTMLSEASPPSPAPISDLKEQCAALTVDCAARLERLAGTVKSATHPDRIGTLLLLQLVGPALSRHSSLSGFPQAAIVSGSASSSLGLERRPRELLTSLAASCHVTDRPHSYWQFYLTYTLAQLNYWHSVRRSPRMCFEALGTYYYDLVAFETGRHRLASLFNAAFPDHLDLRYFTTPTPADLTYAETLFRELLEPTIDAYGERAAVGILRGLAACRTLGDIATDEFAAQAQWSDNPGEYVELARRIDDKIRDEHIAVDLETYVESSAECSTTHVHDTDRLVVIENGEMHFWNNVGVVMRFGAGDKMFVPRGRLHGSVVLSGECTYHQPIITPELLRAARATNAAVSSGRRSD